jgi:hypothetical protein
MIESLAKIAEFDVAPDDSDVLGRPVCHQVGQKSDRIGQCSSGRLKPNHMRRDGKKISVERKRVHEFQAYSLAIMPD